MNINKYNVILTTYNVLTLEKNKNGILYKYKWHRVILDEAH